MRRMQPISWLWPGLPQLWQGGSWPALALAMGCAVMLNLLVLASFVWTELLGRIPLGIGWIALGVIWFSSALIGASQKAAEPTRNETHGHDDSKLLKSDELFKSAMQQYLRGHYFEAETTLGAVLAAKPADAEARLLLATLFRRGRRWDEALAELDRTEQSAAGGWNVEVAAERELIARAMSPQIETEQATAAAPAKAQAA